jgi:predicted dehydrogenase
VLLYLMGAVDEVFGYWHLGATHKIESEDLVCAVMHYASGATGIIQAATALWPGYPERIEIHGTKGSAIVTGDQLTTWDVKNDRGVPAPVSQQSKSGASDPMAISLTPFERQLADFGEACKTGRPPASSGIEGYRALQLVRSIYTSCAEGRKVKIPEVVP